MAVHQQTYTVEEFMELAQLPEYADKQLELIDGELIIMPPSRPINSEIAGLIIYFILAFVRPKKLGRVTVPDGGYRIGAKTTLVPDVAYTAYARGLDFSGSVVEGAPDLVAEVISPSESSQDVQDKVWAYLQAGTQIVWAVYPKKKLVDVYRLASQEELQSTRIGIDGVLDGGDVLPGFTLPVKDIFPEEAK
jgi:Uma2 family endonuclease